MKRILLFCLFSQISILGFSQGKFEKFKTWFNVSDPNTNAIRANMVMTNNTIRKNSKGEIYQYSSFAQSVIDRNLPGITGNELVFERVDQYFSDRDHFKKTANNKITIKIKKNGNNLDVEFVNHTWGGGATFRNVEAYQEGLGYFFRFKDGNSYFTISIYRYAWFFG